MIEIYQCIERSKESKSRTKYIHTRICQFWLKSSDTSHPVYERQREAFYTGVTRKRKTKTNRNQDDADERILSKFGFELRDREAEGEREQRRNRERKGERERERERVCVCERARV